MMKYSKVNNSIKMDNVKKNVYIVSLELNKIFIHRENPLLCYNKMKFSNPVNAKGNISKKELIYLYVPP